MADDWDEEEPTATTNLGEFAVRVEQTRNRPCITVMSGSSTGLVHKLTPGSHVIGRAPNAELRIIDDGISRHHASVVSDGEILRIADLGSRNGTYVNGTKLGEAVLLSAGDKIQIGRTTVLRFAYHDELDESFHESLLSSALRDPSTKLFNRRYLMDRLDSELKFARRHETAVSVLMLDLDHFKRINDSYGHLGGDAVLAHMATVLVHAVRNEDVVARFGGEEFVIVLRAISIDLAVQLGERLRRLVEATTIDHQDKQIKTTVSIGAAGFPSTKAETVEQLLEAADQALYRAKHAGRNCVSR
ncbi:MAG: GGDEF domain-containing protein [Kofleriaceae bacterium]